MQFCCSLCLMARSQFAEIVSQLQARDAAVTREDVSETLAELAHYGLIDDAGITPPSDLTSTDLERYESQIRFFSVLDSSGTKRYDMQARLKRGRVAVLGLGGLGSNIVMGLATMGIGYIRGIDFDRVELSNLNRQLLYDVLDIGHLKVRAAQEQLQRFNADTRFDAINCRIEGPDHIIELIQGTDMAVMCADTPPIIGAWMNEAALKERYTIYTGWVSRSCGGGWPFRHSFSNQLLALSSFWARAGGQHRWTGVDQGVALVASPKYLFRHLNSG